MQDDLRQLKKRSGQASDSDSDSDSARRRKTKVSYLEEELARYSKGRGRAALKAGNRRGRKDDDDDLLAEMGRFSKRVAMAGDDDGDDDDDDNDHLEGNGDEAGLAEMLGGEESREVDDDVGWLKHKLKFVVDEKELTRRAEDEYAVS